MEKKVNEILVVLLKLIEALIYETTITSNTLYTGQLIALKYQVIALIEEGRTQ